jgi:hypothetical protein
MKMKRRATDALAAATARVRDEGPDLALRLTLIDLLFVPVGPWSVSPFVMLLAAAGLLHRAVLRSPATWLLLTVFTGWRVVHDWPMADNHAYLLCYWCLAVFLSLLAPCPAASLSQSARSLVTLVFVFAVIWKAFLSPDYLDGTFFRVLLLSDRRFESLSLSVGGMSTGDLEAAREFLEEKLHDPKRVVPNLIEPPSQRRLASMATWGSLTMEALVAFSFLMPERAATVLLRSAALLVFCAITYAVAPISGFGWVLLAMGVAQSPQDAHGLRLLHVVCFALLLLYKEIPWLAWCG